MKISVEILVQAAIENVWESYTSPAAIMVWNTASDDWHTTAATVDLRVGGIFSSRMEAKDGSVGFDFSGVYTKVEKHKLIDYTFGDRTAQISFEETLHGVRLRVTFDAEKIYSEEQQREGWQAILTNFKHYVEAKKSLSN